MNVNDLHQLPDSHPIAKRERISLAHIDTAAHLRRNRENFAKAQKKAAAKNEAAAGGFTIGQAVQTRRNETGTVAAIEAGKISVEIDGSVRMFAASFLTAA